MIILFSPDIQNRDQHFIMMIDPATTYDRDGYAASEEGLRQDVFIKRPDGQLTIPVVWPGPTTAPDWTHPNTSAYWTGQFASFFNPENGLNISG